MCALPRRPKCRIQRQSSPIRSAKDLLQIEKIGVDRVQPNGCAYPRSPVSDHEFSYMQFHIAFVNVCQIPCAVVSSRLIQYDRTKASSFQVRLQSSPERSPVLSRNLRTFGYGIIRPFSLAKPLAVFSSSLRSWGVRSRASLAGSGRSFLTFLVGTLGISSRSKAHKKADLRTLTSEFTVWGMGSFLAL